MKTDSRLAHILEEKVRKRVSHVGPIFLSYSELLLYTHDDV